jgi:hypothetical protein
MGRKKTSLPKMMTRQEVARHLRKSERTIDRWCRVGLLEFVKIDNSVLVSQESVAALLRTGGQS